MDVSDICRRRFVLLIFCAVGAMNLLFYVFIGDPVMKGRQLVMSFDGGGSNLLLAKIAKNYKHFKISSGYKNNVVTMNTREYPDVKHFPNALRQLKVAEQPEDRNLMTVYPAKNPILFTFPINLQSECSENVSLGIIIISGIQNFERRHGIRNSWGTYVTDPHLNTSLVFMVGKGDNSDIQSQIEKEAELYGDIVQVDMTDSYENLTLKSVAMLHWVTDFCPKSRFILKTDDDMFINVPHLLNVLSSQTEDRYIMGYIINKAAPIRNRHSKWFTSMNDYSEKYFPRYASGTAYAFTTSVSRDLRNAAAQTKHFWLEDVFITGMCAQKALIPHCHNNGFWYGKRNATGCAYQNAVSGHEVTVTQMNKIFSELQALSADCDIK